MRQPSCNFLTSVLYGLAARYGEGAVLSFAVEARFERGFQTDAVRASGELQRVCAVGFRSSAVGSGADLIDGDDRDAANARG